ncbi:MAG: sigma-70 family RNA polymerase sigma factor, partial [Clostridia bacterium]|nr:sigma-70 family RNA polymerase sigma factor [Clostridia bacterium]
IARNKAADYIRRASRYGSVPIEDAEREITQLQSLEEDVLLEEEKRALWDAMNKLNADYRAVLYLIYFEELSYDEAGRVLKRSRSQMKNLVHRAKASLREKLVEGGFVYEGI